MRRVPESPALGAARPYRLRWPAPLALCLALVPAVLAWPGLAAAAAAFALAVALASTATVIVCQLPRQLP
jgi:hypothetical protein